MYKENFKLILISNVLVITVLLILNISAKAQSNNYIYDDPRITKWSQDFFEGKRSQILAEVEKDLLSGNPHEMSAQIWCFLLYESGKLPETWNNLDNPKLRLALGERPTIFLLFENGKYKELLRKYPPSKVVELADNSSITSLVRAARSEAEPDLELQYAMIALNLHSNDFDVLWGIYNLYDTEKARSKLAIQIKPRGKLFDTLAGNFIKELISDPHYGIQNEKYLSIMDVWLKKNKSDRHMLYNKAFTLQENNRYSDAENVFLKAIELFPFHRDNLVVRYLKTLIKLNKIDEANAYAAKYSSLAREGLKAKEYEYYLLARAFYISGSEKEKVYFEKGLQVLDKAEKEGLKGHLLLNQRAWLKSASTSSSGALELADQAIKASPNTRKYYKDYIEISRNTNGTEKLGYNKFLEYDEKFEQKSEDVFEDVSTILLKDKKNKEQIEICRRAVKEFPGSAWMHRELGDALMENGQDGLALVAYLKSFELDSPSSFYFNRYISLFKKSKSQKEVKAEISKIIKRFPWTDRLRNYSNNPKTPKIDAVNLSIMGKTRLITQLGHIETINSVKFSSDKKFIVTGGKDRKVRLWETQTGFEINVFSDHKKSVSSVDFSPDGSMIASGGKDGNVFVREIGTGKLIAIKTLNFAVSSIDFSPDGKTLAISGADTQVGLFNINSKEVIKKFEETAIIDEVKFSADMRLVLTASKGSLKIWNFETGEQIQSYSCGNNYNIVSFDISSDNRIISTVCNDKTTKLWHAGTGVQTGELKNSSNVATAISFISDNEFILGFRDGKLKLFSVEDLKEKLQLEETKNQIKSIDVSNESDLLIAGGTDGNAYLFDIKSGKRLRELSGYSSNITSISIADKKNLIISGNKDSDVQIWDMATGSQSAVLKGHKSLVTSIDITKNNKLIASGGGDRTIYLWNIETNKKVGNLFDQGSSEIRKVKFSPNGNYLFSIDVNNTLSLWDVAKEKLVKRYSDQLFYDNVAAFSPDSKYLLVIFQTDSGSGVARLHNTLTGRTISSEANQKGFGNDVSVIDYAKNSKVIATGSNSGEVNIWDIRTGESIHKTTQKGAITGLRFAQNNNAILVTSTEDKAKYINFQDTSLSKEFGIESVGDNFIKSSPDGKFVLTGDENSLVLWDKLNGQKLNVFPNTEDVNPVTEFLPESKRLLIGGNDSSTKVVFLDSFDFEKTRNTFKAGEILCQFVSFEDKTWAVVDDLGRYDASNQGLVTGLHWAVGTKTLSLDQLKEKYWEPELLAKVLGFNNEKKEDVNKFSNPKLAPEAKTELFGNNKKLKIQLKNQGGGIGRVQVFVNNKEVIADARTEDLKHNPNQPSAELVVDLSVGEKSFLNGKDQQGNLFKNAIRVKTWNVEEKISSKGVEVFSMGDPKKNLTPPKLYAIIGGVSNYSGERIDLTFAGKDASDMAQVVESGARKMLCKNKINSKGCDERINITLLSDYSKAKGAIPPTKENFVKAFEKAKEASAADILIVYLSGHGIVAKNKGKEFYAYLTNGAKSSNSSAFDEETLKLHAITSIELTNWIKQIPAVKQVMILDTCAAGAATGDIKLVDKRQLSGDQVRAIARLKDTTGFYVLMGSAADKVSYEASTYGQGLLTYSLLFGIQSGEGLKSDEADVGELFGYSTRTVPDLATNIGGIQKPKVITPVNSQPFPIGIFTSAEKQKIKLPKRKPMFLQPVLRNDSTLGDNLSLEKKVTNYLVNEIFLKSRNGEDIDVLFVDSKEHSESYQIVGRYRVKEGKVSLEMWLNQNNEPVSKKAVIKGSVQEEAEINVIAEKIVKTAKSLINYEEFTKSIN